MPQTLEAFRHAGIRVWMLTGDKIETATCIAVAAGLKSRQHTILTLAGQVRLMGQVDRYFILKLVYHLIVITGYFIIGMIETQSAGGQTLNQFMINS